MSKVSILVVGTREELLVRILSKLNDLGFEAMAASSHDQALQLYAAHSFDVVFVGMEVLDSDRSYYHNHFEASYVADIHPGSIDKELDRLRLIDTRNG